MTFLERTVHIKIVSQQFVSLMNKLTKFLNFFLVYLYLLYINHNFTSSSTHQQFFLGGQWFWCVVLSRED